MAWIHTKQGLSVFYSFLGFSIFGFSFLFSKQALMVASPFELLAVRFVVAFLILNCLMLTGKCKLHFSGKRLFPLFLLGFIEPVLYFICENFGIQLLATSLVGIVISLVPVVCILLGYLMLGEAVRPFQIVCAVVSIFGVALTVAGQTMGAISVPGLLAIFGAVITASLFTVFSRKISGDFSAFERTYAMCALGAVVFTAAAFLQAGAHPQTLLTPLADAGFWMSILYLGGVSSVLAFFILNYAMTHISVAHTAIFANITTVISILAGVLILHETFGIYQLIGSLIIIACVCGVNIPARKKPEACERMAEPQDVKEA